ncbi:MULTISPECIES: hypothetical protein [unclassified Leifsonia]|uniref:hypothetical protein n=1 Tax=unclassified Leifsonia TaxID=2663824 RepID=UPI0011142D26|nr:MULTISPECIES: hypothetical protein [unclassified Leifsonia]
MLLDSGADGEILVLKEGPWVDPFSRFEDESEVNQQFIREHGKWAFFDVGNEAAVRPSVGIRLVHVEPVLDAFHHTKLVGVTLESTAGVIECVTGADELLVEFNPRRS